MTCAGKRVEDLDARSVRAAGTPSVSGMMKAQPIESSSKVLHPSPPEALLRVRSVVGGLGFAGREPGPVDRPTSWILYHTLRLL
jgi:hypothetical protein